MSDSIRDVEPVDEVIKEKATLASFEFYKHYLMRGAQTGATLGAIVSVPYYYSYLKGSNTLWKTIGNGSLFFMGLAVPFFLARAHYFRNSDFTPIEYVNKLESFYTWRQARLEDLTLIGAGVGFTGGTLLGKNILSALRGGSLGICFGVLTHGGLLIRDKLR